MRPLRLRWRGTWDDVWSRNSTEEPPGRVFFNPQSGEITDLHPMLTFSPEEQARDELITETGKGIEIPPLSKWEHHKIFTTWLTQVPEFIWESPVDASDRELFFRTVQDHFSAEEWDELKDSFATFNDAALREKAEAWLRGQGVTVEWT